MPIHDLELTVKVPVSFAGTQARLVFLEKDVPVKHLKNAFIRMIIPRLDAMESVEIMLSGQSLST
jgi:hypothetical protein